MSSFWDERFNSETFVYGTKPNQFIKDQSDLIAPNSSVLCLAEGEGRNAVFLAKLGHRVTAVDYSPVALAKSNKLACDLGVEIKTDRCDLTCFVPTEKYDAITTTFLHLPYSEAKKLFRKSIGFLKKGGVFIGEFFSTKQMELSSGGPRNIDMLYTTELFEGLDAEIIYLNEEVVHLNEGDGHRGEASVIRVVLRA